MPFLRSSALETCLYGHGLPAEQRLSLQCYQTPPPRAVREARPFFQSGVFHQVVGRCAPGVFFLALTVFKLKQE